MWLKLRGGMGCATAVRVRWLQQARFGNACIRAEAVQCAVGGPARRISSAAVVSAVHMRWVQDRRGRTALDAVAAAGQLEAVEGDDVGRDGVELLLQEGELLVGGRVARRRGDEHLGGTLQGVAQVFARRGAVLLRCRHAGRGGKAGTDSDAAVRVEVRRRLGTLRLHAPAPQLQAAPSLSAGVRGPPRGGTRICARY